MKMIFLAVGGLNEVFQEKVCIILGPPSLYNHLREVTHLFKIFRTVPLSLIRGQSRRFEGLHNFTYNEAAPHSSID